ncbi:MAG: TRAP transporter large permease [Rhodospirillaceae bacterium]|nr:TRAP transporter large permease [Rhodospirillaceae bacterium]MBT6429805.1 TRAP transporter large permease [Rhodospirillaceae bacterium]MBT6607749.1 TRAP transporter large permease [Rhodospirillaceae bacterium]MBT7760280.1 TRAP transporter large permease [Rhodospirillaceae bacterium]
MFDPGTTGIIVMVFLFVILAIGVHIGVALGLAGLLGMTLTIGTDAALAQLASVPFAMTNSFTLAVIPLFILMGSLATQARLTTDLYTAAFNWLGRLPGGLAMATTVASAAFGAACGSTVVNAAVFTRIAMPEMTRYGYDKRLSAGCIAASGTLASLIPPSILMVIYAIITEQSVATLLVAGLVPGILSAVIYMVGIYVRVRLNPKIAPIPDIQVSRREKWESLYGVWGITFLFALVIGGIYAGWFIPTYAGAIGAFGAFVIVIAKRRFTRKAMVETFKDAGVTTTTIFIIVIGGILFARWLTYTGLVADISDTLLAMQLPPYMYLACFAVTYLILGMLIDPIAIMVMTLPVMFPIMTGVGYDPIWLGVISIKLAEISLITPPVGLNVYVVRSASPVPLSLEDVFAGIMPFLLLDVVTLGLLIAFPQIVLFLPTMMM